MSEHVDFPQFELFGPPCKTPGCKGLLVDHMTINDPKECWKQCSVCKAQFNRMPAADALGYALRVIDRVLKSEKIS